MVINKKRKISNDETSNKILNFCFNLLILSNYQVHRLIYFFYWSTLPVIISFNI